MSNETKTDFNLKISNSIIHNKTEVDKILHGEDNVFHLITIKNRTTVPRILRIYGEVELKKVEFEGFNPPYKWKKELTISQLSHLPVHCKINLINKTFPDVETVRCSKIECKPTPFMDFVECKTGLPLSNYLEVI